MMNTNNKMQAEEAKDEYLKRLLPCPFCGGGITEFRENGAIWEGMKYSDPVSVSVRHWCAEMPGPSRAIERIGKDKEQAIERWNMRFNAAARLGLLESENFRLLSQIDILENAFRESQTKLWKLMTPNGKA